MEAFGSTMASSDAAKGFIEKMTSSDAETSYVNGFLSLAKNTISSAEMALNPSKLLDLILSDDNSKILALLNNPMTKTALNLKGITINDTNLDVVLKDIKVKQFLTIIKNTPNELPKLILDLSSNETVIRALLSIAITDDKINKIINALKNEVVKRFITEIKDNTDVLNKIIPYFTHKDHIESSESLASNLLNGNCDGLNAELIEKIKQFNPGTQSNDSTQSNDLTQSDDSTQNLDQEPSTDFMKKVYEKLNTELTTNLGDDSLVNKFAEATFNIVSNKILNLSSHELYTFANRMKEKEKEKEKEESLLNGGSKKKLNVSARPKKRGTNKLNVESNLLLQLG